MKISIGINENETIIEIWHFSYVRIGSVKTLMIFKWCPYASAGNGHYILGFVIKGS